MGGARDASSWYAAYVNGSVVVGGRMGELGDSVGEASVSVKVGRSGWPSLP